MEQLNVVFFQKNEWNNKSYPAIVVLHKVVFDVGIALFVETYGNSPAVFRQINAKGEYKYSVV